MLIAVNSARSFDPDLAIPMCGIIGYVGHRNTLDVLLAGLKRMEYRGYDSAGVAMIIEAAAPNGSGNGSGNGNGHDVVVANGMRIDGAKTPGKLKNLEEEFRHWRPKSRIGIGHTRWATHGEPNQVNAHPHYSQDGSVAVIHNGIIENFSRLRAELTAAGTKFVSETDTEVLAHLIARERAKGTDLLGAVRASIQRCDGAWALLAIDVHEPDRIIAARRNSPLILGIGNGENFLASDVSAVIEYTRRVVYLAEGDVVDITPERARIFDADGLDVSDKRRVDTIDWDIAAAEKNGEPHYMLKEIKEQPDVLHKTLHAYLHEGEIRFPDLKLTPEQLRGFDRIIIEACGTAWHAGLVAKHAIEELARVPTEVWLASEFRYANPIITDRTLVIAITQSGETEDTKKALVLAKERGATAICVCNVKGSSIPRESHGVIYTHAGPEIGVASTKAYTTQLLVLMLLAVHLGKARGELITERERELIDELDRIPELARQAVELALPQARDVATRFTYALNYMYLGRQYNLPTALEGALKLKELSYIHAEGYGAGEMKHGPIALVEPTFPVVVVVPRGRTLDKLISNLKEVEARKGILVCVATEGLRDEDLKGLAHFVIDFPESSELFSPILAVIPLQLLAYYVATFRGNNPDQPRNLAKAVTVE